MQDAQNPTQSGRNALGIRYVQAGPPGTRAVLNQIIAAMDFLYPRATADIVPSVSKDGTLYRFRQAQPASTLRAVTAPIFPFQVYVSDTSTAGTIKASIRASSRVYSLLTSFSSFLITDLVTEFTLATDTCVWLEFTVSSLTVTAVARKTGSAFPAPVVTSGSPAAQTQFNVPIGRVVASAPTKPGFEFFLAGAVYHFEQCLFSHLIVEGRTLSPTVATPVLYAFPFGGSVP